VSIVDILRHVMRDRNLPQVPAWQCVDTAIARASGGLQFFCRRPKKMWAIPVPAGSVMTVAPPGRRMLNAGLGRRTAPVQQRRVDVLGWLRLELSGSVDLDETTANYFAITASDAQRVFGYVTDAAAQPEAAEAERAVREFGERLRRREGDDRLNEEQVACLVNLYRAGRIYEPEGGEWPHKKGFNWTEAERCAAFKTRHKGKLKRDELAWLVGVAGQSIDEQIGPRTAPARCNWGGTKWRPPPALSEECGFTPKIAVVATSAGEPARAGGGRGGFAAR
jgi:hypothetical protein